MKLMIPGLLLSLCEIASAQSPPSALSGFTSVQTDPVFTGEPGQWDELIRERGWVMHEDGGYRMWYTGYRMTPDGKRGRMKVGYATSVDGVHWKRHPSNPVYEDTWTEDMMVVRRGNELFMFAEGLNDQAHLLKSSDGISWTRIGVLDVRLTSGERFPPGPYGTPTAWFENGTWYLFYERRDQGVWLATSTDMKVWTNVDDEPVISPGPTDYDKLMIAMNQVVKLGDQYIAVLHGTGTPTKPRDWCTYFATSSDLRTWQKSESGPVLPIKDNKSSGVLVRSPSGFRLFTMHGRVDLHEAHPQE